MKVRLSIRFVFAFGAILFGAINLLGQLESTQYHWLRPADVGLSDFNPGPVPEYVRPSFRDRINYKPYLPDTLHKKSRPRKYVQMAFHYMNTADTFYTEYEGQEGQEFARSLVYYMNTHLDRNSPYFLNPDLPVYDPTWRFQLGRKPGTEEYAVYHHYSDTDYDYLHAGPDVNRSRRNVNKYTEGLDSLLHVFIMAPPRDSVESPTFKPEDPLGLWNGRAIKVTGYYPRLDPWRYRRNLNHEAGHAFGLPHAWLRRDGCDDTVPHPNRCWNEDDERPGCDTLLSNNVMDYNNYQQALTPCQIGRVNATFSRRGGPQRAWIRPDWCQHNPNFTARITQSDEWTGDRDIRGDLIIKEGVRLRIDCRVHLPSGSRVRIEPGGILELGPNALLHNDCGLSWLGLELGRDNEREAQIVTEPGFRIENISQDQ
ncbi:MAG: hypothetical protein AAFY36_09845 [Bacteroidota bacterium]